MSTPRAELAELWKLQELDSNITELDKTLVYVPEMLEKLQNEIHAYEADIAELDGELKHIRHELGNIEQELLVERDESERFNAKLLEVRSNKEYDAVQIEIRARQDRVVELETGMQRLNVDYDRLSQELDESRVQLEEASTTNAGQIEGLRMQIEVVNARKQQLDSVRADISAKLSRKTLGIYERIRKGAGVAVVKVRRKACGGCHREIPPQRISELKAGDKFMHCDNCGRIMLWDEESAQS